MNYHFFEVKVVYPLKQGLNHPSSFHVTFEAIG